MSFDVVDWNSVDDVEWLVAGTDRGSAADQNLCAGTRLAAVGDHVDTGGTTLKHGIDVGNYANVGRVGIDGGDRSRDCLALLYTVANGHDVLQGDCATLESERNVDGRTAGDGYDLLRRGVSDPGGPHAMRTHRHAYNNETAVGASDGTTACSFHFYRNVREGLISTGIDDPASYDPRDFLRADRDGPHETNHKREHQTTNDCHTEALHGVGSGNFLHEISCTTGCADPGRANVTGLSGTGEVVQPRIQTRDTLNAVPSFNCQEGVSEEAVNDIVNLGELRLVTIVPSVALVPPRT